MYIHHTQHCLSALLVSKQHVLRNVGALTDLLSHCYLPLKFPSARGRPCQKQLSDPLLWFDIEIGVGGALTPSPMGAYSIVRMQDKYRT